VVIRPDGFTVQQGFNLLKTFALCYFEMNLPVPPVPSGENEDEDENGDNAEEAEEEDEDNDPTMEGFERLGSVAEGMLEKNGDDLD
ncbi:hypothetical protein AK812_SmicGene46613, partial [Symbiodinium microadriaticum]